MSNAIDLLRAIHIGAGTLALLTFWIPLVVTKGNRLHRRAGGAYAASMYAASATAFGVVPLRLVELPPDRWPSPIFLAYVGLLSFVATFHAQRVLKMKERTGPAEHRLDLALPLLLVVASVSLAVYGIVHRYVLGVAFAPVGLVTALPQLRTLRRAPESRTWWLRAHLSNMVIACIGTLTAFLVNVAPRISEVGRSPFVWFLPTVVLIPLMRRFQRKYASPKPAPELEQAG